MESKDTVKKAKDDNNEKIGELESRIKELENDVLVAKADLINYRKRKDEEVSGYLKYASSDLIYELLPVLDNFERAIKLDDNNLTDELSKFLTGFKMIYVSLKELLESDGLKEFGNVGEEFNPNIHDCVFTDNDKAKDDDVILDVLLKGYMYKDKVLRCASVKVNKLEGDLTGQTE